jgi:restriction endonuclease
MREFYGVMASHKLQRGTFAISSTFSADARQFAQDYGISPLDSQGLNAGVAKGGVCAGDLSLVCQGLADAPLDAPMLAELAALAA